MMANKAKLDEANLILTILITKGLQVMLLKVWVRLYLIYDRLRG